MKRFLSVSIVLLSVYSTFAYEDADITNANALASNNIIVDQSQNPEKYNLDAKILRQEVIGMALKIKGITLPENYTCKKYFTDVTANDWVCRAIEIAADNGIITRANQQANPTKYVTGSEALAMMMRAGGINIEQYTSSDRDQLFIPQGTINPQGWQIDVMSSATTQGIIFPYAINQEGFESPYRYSWNYNDFIVRREVFDIVINILLHGESYKKYLEYSAPNDYVVEYENGMKTYVEDNIRYFEDTDVIYTVAKQPMVCPKKTCSSADFGVKTLFGDGVKILTTEHRLEDLEGYPDSDIYTVKITVDGDNVLGYVRIIPDFDHKIIYKLQALTAQENFAAQKERLERFINSIDFYQGDVALETKDLEVLQTYLTYSFPGEYTVQYEKGMKVVTNKDMILFQDKDVTYSIFKQKRTCDAPCGDGYYNALQFDGKGVTNYNTQYTDDGILSEIIVEGKTGKSKGFSRTIFLPDVAYNIKAITKEENYDAQTERLKRFIESIVFYNGTPAEQAQKRNWEILRSYLAIQLKTMAADPEKATVEMCFQILDSVPPGTNSYSVYEIHNAICGGDPFTSPHYGEFYVGGQRVYKNEFTLDGEDNWVMMD